MLSESEIDHVVQQLTLEEKVSMLAGQNSWETRAIDRLSIPALKVTDGPNGARGEHFLDGPTAACFPASVSLASTFDKDLAWKIGQALGDEAQTKGAHVLLGPTVCLHRSPLGGRNFEAFSEDPLLSGAMAAGYVKGMQEGSRVGATVKHYAANEQETRRFDVDETVSQRALREIYLKPFEIVVKDADPWCMMMAYNKVNGKHIDDQPSLLIDVLRDQWGWTGLMMSDWGACSNVGNSIKYGLDLEMPGPPIRRKFGPVKAALDAGECTIENIDSKIKLLLRLLNKTGKFDDRREPVAEHSVRVPAHEQLIRQAGADGMVLLKNDNNTLPLAPKTLKKIALLGPLAKTASAHGGGSASLNCHYKVSAYDAFVERLGSDVEITTAPGAHIFRVYPPMTESIYADAEKTIAGFKGEYFLAREASANLDAVPYHAQIYLRSQLDTLLNETVAEAKSARYTATFVPTKSGKHYWSYSSCGPSTMYIDGQEVANQPQDTLDSMPFVVGAQDELRFQHDMVAGQAYELRVVTERPLGCIGDLPLLADVMGAHIGFVYQDEMERDLLGEAVALATAADFAIVFVGNNTMWETEGLDMETMALPTDGSQDTLVAAVAAVNPKTVVVLTTGTAKDLPWLDSVPALVQTWYAGQEAGNSLLDVLLGDVNPSGKLPFSWPRRIEDMPSYGHFGLDAYDTRKVEYKEGVYVGYRHFDRHATDPTINTPLFPFGYGLSYTDFAVDSASVEGTLSSDLSKKVVVSATVRNTGQAAGAESVQVYVVPPSGGIDRPIKELGGFAKVFLQPGESQTVTITLDRTNAAYWDETTDKWAVAAGDHELLVAHSSAADGGDVKLSLPSENAFFFDA
ncbi:glycoside hydrolase family 3 [Ophiostoma piceae UAMH 11346]|uniref:beta-glucosidase n=1 Tax=Ophiostoma piceae (strain UAMH 11346) TaxID=1262450 RepID=S3CCT0_OPHP1|nr:glycoside hydrolase family 3 [Ophiostoma piceae UAMH 11346]